MPPPSRPSSHPAGELAADRAELSSNGTCSTSPAGRATPDPGSPAAVPVIGLDPDPELLERGKALARRRAWRSSGSRGRRAAPTTTRASTWCCRYRGSCSPLTIARTAAEVARVLRPGGRMVLCNWTPEATPGCSSWWPRTCRRRPRASNRPCSGAPRITLRSLFEGTGIEPGFDSAEVIWSFDSADGAFDTFLDKFGPVIKAKETLEPEGSGKPWRAICAPSSRRGPLPMGRSATPRQVPGQHRHEVGLGLKLRGARPRRLSPRRGAAWRPRSACGPRPYGRRGSARPGRGPR